MITSQLLYTLGLLGQENSPDKIYVKVNFESKSFVKEQGIKFEQETNQWYVDLDYNVGNLQYLTRLGHITDCYILKNNTPYRITLPEPQLCPDGFLSEYQWMKRHQKVPLSENVIETFVRLDQIGMPLRDENYQYVTYQYISPKRVIDATLEQIAEFNKKEEEKREHRPTKPKVKKDTSLQPIKPIANTGLIDCSKFVDSALRNTQKSSIFNPTNIVCFDTETTGTGKEDELIQITLVDGNNKILLDTFVKPYYKQSWEAAEKVNGISPQIVKDAPYPHEIAPFIRDIFEQAQIIVGHNVNFDIRMVEQNLHISFEGKEIFDTLEQFRRDKPGKGGHKLGDAVEYYCPELLDTYKNGAHKSDIDTMCTLTVYQKQIEKIKNIEQESNEIEIDFS